MADTSDELSKEFNDPVHGFIELGKPLLAFIDTPQFQRLRYIKQLGLTYFVYFGAMHSRFEHCMGTCYLAGLLVRRLRDLQPELDITCQDILCIEIAALCHDIGHGPFSHSFEMFMNKARPERQWLHEEASLQMIDDLIASNSQVQKELSHAGLQEHDVIFIKELINGKQTPASGRDKRKAFLYQIVANKETGIDVDKFDYFVRDCHHSGLRYGFDHLRRQSWLPQILIDSIFSDSVLQYQIVNDLGDMFQFRYLLHRRAYQHRTTRLLEHMMTEVLLAADRYVVLEGKNKKKFTISESVDDMVAYCQLRDSIIDTIRWSKDDRLAPAKAILENIERRKLYKRIGEAELNEDEEIELHNYLAETCEIEDNDIVVVPIKFTFGHGLKNPLENVLFFEKGSSIPQELSSSKGTILTRFNAEKYFYRKVNIYLKNSDDAALCKKVLSYFTDWCDSHSARSKANDLDFTPHKGTSLSLTFSPPDTVKRTTVPTNDNQKCRRLLQE